MRRSRPQIGNVRRRTWFAWRPVRTKKEWRWLERVAVKQVYCQGCLQAGQNHFWDNLEFVDPIKF